MADIPEKIQRILDYEVERMVNQYQPLGILLVGSFANGRPGDYSDLDIYIVVEDQDWRERGNYFVDDVEIEYFINPVRQIRAYFEEESEMRPHAIHMWATGKVMYSKDPVIEELVSEAKNKLTNYSEMDNSTRELYQYYVDDARKDLLNNKDGQESLAYQLTAMRLFDKLIEICCKYHKTFIEKTTMLYDQLQDLDDEFADLITNCITHKYNYQSMDRIISYVEETYLGGKRKENWTLRGPLRL